VLIAALAIQGELTFQNWSLDELDSKLTILHGQFPDRAICVDADVTSP